MTAVKRKQAARRRPAAKGKGAQNAKPEGETVTAQAAGAGTAQEAAGDQVKVAVDTDAPPVGAVDDQAGTVLSDDGSTGGTQEGGGSAQEAGPAGNAETAQPADARPGDSAASDAASATDVPAAPSMDALDAEVVVPGVTGEVIKGNPALAHSEGHAADAMAYVFMGSDFARREPPEIDMPLWAAFRAQRAVARALADDGAAPCLSFRQCELIAELLTKSPEAAMGALGMQLKLKGVPLSLEPPLGAALLEAFRAAWTTVRRYLDLKEVFDTPPADPRPVTIPERDRALKLMPEPLALSDTAKGR